MELESTLSPFLHSGVDLAEGFDEFAHVAVYILAGDYDVSQHIPQ